MAFRDRRDAGRRLAELCKRCEGADTVVLGLARGGVPVAAEVARALRAPLDVMVARKIGAPGQPEFGIGAIAPGVRVLDRGSVAAVGATTEEIDQIVADEEQEMQRRYVAYRGSPAPPDVFGKRVVLVDDGLATGVTARAAIRSLRKQEPERITLAVPVGAPESVDAMRAEADEVIVVEAPADFRAVGAWYDSFDQTSDDEVLAILRPSPRAVRIPASGGVTLDGDLTLPPGARGVVVFAHGSGSSRFSPRNRFVAEVLQRAGLGTLLLDLLTPAEEEVDERTRELRFDVPRLAERTVVAVDWVAREAPGLPVGAFGSSTGAAAALLAAAERPALVRTVVSRGGRPDLAGDALPRVQAPTLLLVGGRDEGVIELNEEAASRLTRCHHELVLIAGATHLFEEPGALDEVAHVAAQWFGNHFGSFMLPDPRSSPGMHQ